MRVGSLRPGRYLRAAVDMVEAREALRCPRAPLWQRRDQVKAGVVRSFRQGTLAPDAKAAIERYHLEMSVDRTLLVGCPSDPTRSTSLR